MFKKILTNPKIKNLKIDSPQRTEITKSIIQILYYLVQIDFGTIELVHF